MSASLDLAAEVFTTVVTSFYDESGQAKPFRLLPKADTQDDPFDRYVIGALRQSLPTGIKVLPSNKKLVSPDLVIARPEETQLLLGGGKELDERQIVAVEIKKLEPTAKGTSARSTGLDYNSTPPCTTVTVTAANGSPLRIPAFYMFALLAPNGEEQKLSTFALVAGSALNRDVDVYNRATGQRTKTIGLGTYGDGLDRERPMFIFSNPLGWAWMLEEPTFLHERDDLESEQPSLVRVREIERTQCSADGSEIGRHTFWAYRVRCSGRNYEPLSKAVDPFPTPKKRSAETQSRGKFVIDLSEAAMRSL